MAVALEQFVMQLEDCGVLSPDALKDFIPPKAAPKDAADLAKELIRHKKLTKFQAEVISKGKGKSLVMGNYVLMEKIGAGGMGQVFKAEHRRMHRIVAIKLLPAAMTRDKAAIARFEREVTAAAKISHPNIVAAYDADEADGVHFLVMECVDGSDLSALVKRNGPFPVAQAVNYILQAGKGLEAAHAEGIVHRDVKPANLLLDKKGTVRILDMGLARLSGDSDDSPQADLTSTGMIMGTADYMAPEQALDTKKADARADIYALGCSLYYLLTGRATYDGDTIMKKLVAHREHPIPSLRDVRLEVPEKVEAVFKKMIAKKVEDRYQSMTEVIADLEQLGLERSASAASVFVPPTTGTKLTDGALTSGQDVNATPTIQMTDIATTITRPPVVRGKGKNRFAYVVAAAVLLAGIVFSLNSWHLKPVAKVDQVDAKNATVPAKNDSIAVQAVLVEEAASKAAKPIDLLKLIDLNRDVRAGDWKMEKYALIRIPYLPPPDYQVTVTATRIGPSGHLVVGLQIDAQRATAQVDAHGKRYSGFAEINRRRLHQQNLEVESQPFFRDGISATVVCTVRNGAAELTFDGRVISRTSPASIHSLESELSSYNLTPIFLHSECAFRITKLELLPLDATAPGRPIVPITTPKEPGFQQWLAHAFALPTEEQVEAVAGKLKELNPDFDGKVTRKIENGTVTEVAFSTDNVTDISPVRALVELKGLVCRGSAPRRGQLTDLSPLAGMRLTRVDCSNTSVFDLSPLAGIPLTTFECENTLVCNLSPLKGTSLTSLNFRGTCVADLSIGGVSVLQGMNLTNLDCGQTPVGDLSTLTDLPLTSLRCDHIPASNLTPLRKLPLKTIDCDLKAPQLDGEHLLSIATLEQINGIPAAEFRKIAEAKQAAFEKWIKNVAVLPAQAQVTAVSDKLKELNPGFDGNVTPTIEDGVVTGMSFATDNVMDVSALRAMVKLKWVHCAGPGPRPGKLYDLSPLKGLPLTSLNCCHTQVADLSPLKGMSLTHLFCVETSVSDLSPLQGVPLTYLHFHTTQVSSLSPLEGMPMISLDCHGTAVSDVSPLQRMRLTRFDCALSQVSDLSPLEGMPLAFLSCYETPITDLTPLRGMSLTEVMFTPKNITKGLDILRQMKSLTNFRTRWDGPSYTAEEFWKKYDAGDFGKPITDFHSPAFVQWQMEVAALPAEKQVEAVAKKLMELNPGFDGNVTPTIKDGVVTELSFAPTDKVLDISPLRALVKLKRLNYPGPAHRTSQLYDLSPLEGLPLTELGFGNTQVSDLSPLKGMSLKFLFCVNAPVSDFSPLEGMPLTFLHCGTTRVSSLSPLKGMPLTELYCVDARLVSDLSPLRGMQLTRLDCGITQVADLSPLKGMPLSFLGCYETPITDLTPLQGMQLTEVVFTPKNITKGLDVLRQMKSLVKIRTRWDSPAHPPEEFWKKYDAGEFTWNTPALQQWIKEVAALPAEKQVEAVTKKLMELNPEFDGKVTDWLELNRSPPLIKDGIVTSFGFAVDHVTDISPVRAVSKLKLLGVAGNEERSGILRDLSPLKGLPLTYLNCRCTQVADLSPLKGMSLTNLTCSLTLVSDLSPLQGMPLTDLNCNTTLVSDLSPLKGMPLTFLHCGSTQVSSLSPLKGMSLTELHCHYAKLVLKQASTVAFF